MPIAQQLYIAIALTGVIRYLWVAAFFEREVRATDAYLQRLGFPADEPFARHHVMSLQRFHLALAAAGAVALLFLE